MRNSFVARVDGRFGLRCKTSITRKGVAAYTFGRGMQEALGLPRMICQSRALAGRIHRRARPRVTLFLERRQHCLPEPDRRPSLPSSPFEPSERRPASVDKGCKGAAAPLEARANREQRGGDFA